MKVERTLDEIKEQVPNLYGGDTEYFNQWKNYLIDFAKKYTIPEICSILFHDFSIMSTPDSLGSYYKLVLKMPVSRKKKVILIDDDEYQMALDERARINGCNYAYYSKTARKKKKLSKQYKDVIEDNLKRKDLQHIISTKGYSVKKLEELEKLKDKLSKEFSIKFKPEHVLNNMDGNYDPDSYEKEYHKALSKIFKVQEEIDVMKGVKILARALGTNMDEFTIIYNDPESYDYTID